MKPCRNPLCRKPLPKAVQLEYCSPSCALKDSARSYQEIRHLPPVWRVVLMAAAGKPLRASI